MIRKADHRSLAARVAMKQSAKRRGSICYGPSGCGTGYGVSLESPTIWRCQSCRSVYHSRGFGGKGHDEWSRRHRRDLVYGDDDIMRPGSMADVISPEFARHEICGVAP